MKRILFLILSSFAISAQAEICGITSSSQVNGQTISLSLENGLSIVLSADSLPAKKFISTAKFLGAAMCNINAPYEAPFNVCFKGGDTTTVVSEIYCGDNNVCSGIACGSSEFAPFDGKH